MYFIIDPKTDDDGNMMGLDYEKDHDGRSWFSGNPFLPTSDLPKFKQPPEEPIKVYIKEGRENDPWPSFLHQPLPVMNTKLLETIRSVGVDNIDAYKAEFYYHDESLASSDYWAINLVGKLTVADLSKSTYDNEQQDRTVAMTFETLVVDKKKTHSMLMFRLAENITTILVHERVKIAVEKANISNVQFFKPSDVAIL
jgi:hypothetical protein